MPRAYLAGPMRHFPDLNFPAFTAAAAAGRAAGYDVTSPHEMDITLGITPESWTDSQAQIDSAFDRDVAVIRSLRPEDGDVIAVLPGWTASVGTLLEFCGGRMRNIRFLDALTWKPFRPEDVENRIDFDAMIAGIKATLLRN